MTSTNALYDIPTLHHGEQSLCREILKIIPLIEKHFKPYDGQRVSIQSGRSAKFNKVCQAFREDCEAVTNARIIVDDNGYSLAVKIDINEPDPKREGCNYFYHTIYFAEHKRINFAASPDMTYNYKPEDTRRYCDKVLKTTIKQIEKVKADIKRHKDAISKLESSIPYQFKDAVSR